MQLVDLSCADWSDFAAVMLSPGVPLTHPAPHWTVEMARAAGVEILGDIELFARAVAMAPEHKRPRVIAITGTNGKSTTTALIGHVLSAAGRDARVGGNIGVGVLSLPDMHGGAVYVLELSSYQLDLTSSLKPDVSILLNVSPDHLERHGSMEGYLAAKRRVLQGQGHGDTAIIGIDDAYGQQICTRDHRRQPTHHLADQRPQNPLARASMPCRVGSMTPPMVVSPRSPISPPRGHCPDATTGRTPPPPMPRSGPSESASPTRSTG